MASRALLTAFVAILVSVRGAAAPLTFTDETDYLNAISLLSGRTVVESFEDDTTWGEVRTTIVGGTHTAPSITSQGIVWTSNNSVSQVTTGPGPAITGNWGFFTLPHGDYANGIGDGFKIASPLGLFGVGGWVDTNTPYAEVNFIVDGVTVLDFGDPVIGTSPVFFGVVDSAGFESVEIREIEGTAEDQKYIFVDDFTISASILAGDYNDDYVVDAADYTVWRDHFGAAAGTLPNDADGGVIGVPQYGTWAANFGAPAGAAAALSTAVPEPACSLFLVVVLCCAAIFWRRARLS